MFSLLKNESQYIKRSNQISIITPVMFLSLLLSFYLLLFNVPLLILNEWKGREGKHDNFSSYHSKTFKSPQLKLTS